MVVCWELDVTWFQFDIAYATYVSTSRRRFFCQDLYNAYCVVCGVAYVFSF